MDGKQMSRMLSMHVRRKTVDHGLIWKLSGYCCNQKTRSASVESFMLWQQATI